MTAAFALALAIALCAASALLDAWRMAEFWPRWALVIPAVAALA